MKVCNNYMHGRTDGFFLWVSQNSAFIYQLSGSSYRVVKGFKIEQFQGHIKLIYDSADKCFFEGDWWNFCSTYGDWKVFELSEDEVIRHVLLENI